MSIKIGDRTVHITGTQVQSDWDEQDITRPGYIKNKPDVATLGQDGKVNPEQLPSLDYVPNTEKGAANGVATLDGQGLIPPAQIPEEAVQDRWWLLDGAQGGDVPADYPIDLDEDVARWLFARLSEKIDVPLMGAANGVATLNEYGKVPPSQLPSLDYVPNSEKAAANGVATLGNDGKVPSSQLPSLDYIPNSEKGTTVATLGNDGKVPSSQLPALDYVPLTRTVNGKALSADISLTPSDIGSLATADTPVSLGVSMDPSTYVLTFQLKNSSNTVLDTKTVDLPLETMVVSASYSNGDLTLTLQSGQTLTVDISDIVYGLVNSDELGAPGGVAQLDENGKVPPEQLPAMDYIPNDEKGAANGVATLDGNSKVPVAQLPIGNVSGPGVLSPWASAGIGATAHGMLFVNRATNGVIDAKESNYFPIVPSNLDYAVRSVLPNITVIPADTTSYALKDASATTNSHSWTYVHTPSSASTYVFPAVTTTNVVHAITLIIDFSTVQTYAFEDSEGNALLPLFTPSISQGDVYAFKCEYSVVQSKWLIYPVKEGGVADDYVMQSQVGAAGGVAELDGNGLVPSANIPMAGANLGGIKTSTSSTTGLYNRNGLLIIDQATERDINTRGNSVRPIMPFRLNYAVRAALTDANKISLTDAQKLSAQDTLGVGPAPLILSAAPTTSTVGVVGQLAVDTVTSKTYHCTAVTNTGTEQEPAYSYTWTDDVNKNGGTFTSPVYVTNSNGRWTKINAGSLVVGYNVQYDPAGDLGSIFVGYQGSTQSGKPFGNGASGFGQYLIVGGNSKATFGKYNKWVSTAVRTVGWGTASNDRFNIEELSESGNHYITGGHQQGVTTIDTATTAYTLAEGVQSHTPSSSSTYTLPAVTDSTRTHDIILLVSFANTQSIAFEDSQGNTIVPLDTLDIVQGDVVEYICSWDWLQDTWVISASHRKPKPAPPLPVYTDGDALEY